MQGFIYPIGQWNHSNFKNYTVGPMTSNSWFVAEVYYASSRSDSCHISPHIEANLAGSMFTLHPVSHTKGTLQLPCFARSLPITTGSVELVLTL